MSGAENGLPKGWVVLQLRDVADSCLGKMLDKTKHTSGRRLPYLRNINVRWGSVDLTDVSEMFFDEDELERYGLRSDDVLVCEGGEPGRAAVWTQPVNGMLFQKALHRIRPHEPLLPHWLVHHLKLQADSGGLAEHFTGTTIRHLTGTSLAKLEVPLPPLPEQRRIVAKVEALQARADAAKEALDAIPPVLEKFRQSVLAAAFRGDLTKTWRAANPDVEPASVLLDRIRAERRRRWEEANPKKKYVEPTPVDTDGLPELPEGWCWASLEEVVANISYGYTESSSPDDRGRKFLRITDLIDGKVDWTSVPYCRPPADNRYDLRTGDIVVARTGATTGKSFRLLDPPSGAVFASYLIRLGALDSCPSDFVALFLQSPLYWSQIMTVRKGSAQPGVNATVLGTLAVPLSPAAEMAQIVRASRIALDGPKILGSSAEAMQTGLASLTQSILAKAFRGELVPQDPNDEPATELLERIRREREGSGATGAPKRGRRAKGV